jgi:hypothetical protein
VFLSAERTALANRTILKTFEQTSVAWQTIPHWDTGDPAQSWIRGDRTCIPEQDSETPVPAPPIGGGTVKIVPVDARFLVTLAQATSDTPDALLASVLAQTVDLAKRFDAQVLVALGGLHVENGEPDTEWWIPFPNDASQNSARAVPGETVELLLASLISGRKLLEDSGFRADSCLVASTTHYKAIYRPVAGVIVAEDLLRAASVNSVHRASQLDGVMTPENSDLSLLLGRRQEIGHRNAPRASPGEEPVDLAVSVPPSLEIIGDTVDGCLELGLRMRYAIRVKDPRGVVVFRSPAESVT